MPSLSIFNHAVLSSLLFFICYTDSFSYAYHFGSMLISRWEMNQDTFDLKKQKQLRKLEQLQYWLKKRV